MVIAPAALVVTPAVVRALGVAPAGVATLIVTPAAALGVARIVSPAVVAGTLVVAPAAALVIAPTTLVVRWALVVA